MHGNARQWCKDWYDAGYYAHSATDDPTGPAKGAFRVDRGGGWYYSAGGCRSADRGSTEPVQGIIFMGFRVSAEGAMMTPAPVPPPPAGSATLAVAPFDEKKAKVHQEAWAKHLGVPVELINSIGMKLVLIPPGEFTMGSPKELFEENLKGLSNEDHFRNCLLSEAPPHRVRITRPFYLARYDVTQEEYQRITGANPSTFSVAGRKEFVRDMDTKQFPVETVSWEEAGDFCRKLSNLPEEKAAGRTYCLPSEAQWEYACRAGSMGRFSFNSGGMPEEEVLYAYGWFFYTEKVSKEKVGTPRPVGLKLPNAWGLYDMHGNVWQWCQDWYDKDYYAKCQSPADDPTGPFGGSSHVLRGGCLGAPAWRCRSAFRNYLDPGARSSAVAGFRVSLILADK
jgi:formylglycine-generating enzyme required for sulfatase activity